MIHKVNLWNILQSFSVTKLLHSILAFSLSVVLVSLLITQLLIFHTSYGQSNSTNMTSSTSPSNPTSSEGLATEMKRLQNSDDPVDMATFAYV